jgi:hypothetical protein
MFWDLLTFERLMTNQVIHLIYWAGLGVIALIAFGFIGTAVGVALREELLMGILLARQRAGGGLPGGGGPGACCGGRSASSMWRCSA